MFVVRVFASAVTITGFVLLVMLLVEYLNVVTRGTFRHQFREGGGRVPAVIMGTVPGCFGAFTNVTLYVHGVLSLGALAGGMVAASGDEAFVMLALFPRRALLLFTILMIYGLLVSVVVDRLFGMRHFTAGICDSGLAIHATEGAFLKPFRWPEEGNYWSLERGVLGISVLVFALAIGGGLIAGDEVVWLRAIVVLIGLLLVWLIVVSPAHFVSEHLVKHVILEHAPRIFLWTVGALAITELVSGHMAGVGTVIRAHPVLALLTAAAVGIIPESGPHLIFVTMYAGGLLPFSVLLTSSIVQDGHGMLPLLAESRSEFVRVKAINVVAGLVLGFAVMCFGY